MADPQLIGVILCVASLMLSARLIEFSRHTGLHGTAARALIPALAFAVFAVRVHKMISAPSRSPARDTPFASRSWAEAIAILAFSFVHISTALAILASPWLEFIPKAVPAIDFGNGFGLALAFIILPSILASLGIYSLAMRFQTKLRAKAIE